MRLLIDLQGAQGPSKRRGIGRFSKELALAMVHRPRGHVVEIALNGLYGAASDELAAAFSGVLPSDHIVAWDSPGSTADIDASGATRRLLAEHIRAQAFAARSPDVVHITSLFEGMDSDVVACWPRSIERLPTVATFYDAIPLIRHEQYLQGMWQLNGLSGPYMRRIQEARLCDGLLAISGSSRQEAIGFVEMAPEDVLNIGAGVGPEFSPVSLSMAERAALLRRYGLRDGFILFLGAGDIRKNEAGLMAGYARLPEALRAAHQLVIVGGSDGQDLIELRRNGLTRADVVTVPYVEEGDMPALYSACTLFVLPSLHEGFGLPAAEAMACGAPVLASNTTSLPEVVGRPDAMFDPEDPAEMAERMAAVLCNEEFRRELAEYGPIQAARFTWQACAERAWDAIELVHDRVAPRAPLRSVLAPRRRLAFVSPLPPDESGIADYCRDLLPALARYYDITLVNQHGSTSDPWLAANFPVIEPAALLDAPQRFDRVIYQVGNSHFHLAQVRDLLPALPGVVMLHDAFLSGMLSFASHHMAGTVPFSTILYASHGYAAVAAMVAEGEDEAVCRYPCSLPTIQRAIGLIQHSKYAQSLLVEHFGASVLRNASLVHFPRRPVPPISRRLAREHLGIADEVFLVCSFGMMGATKLPQRILAGWRQAGFAPPDARLVLVGDTVGLVDKAVRADLSRMKLDHGDVVQGRVSQETYNYWRAAADVAVQLRTASRGETSGAIGDCLAAGLPTIINRHGSTVELPEHVVFGLPDLFTDDELAAALRTLRVDAVRRRDISVAAHRFWEAELHPGACARSYYDAIEASYASGSNAASAGVLAGVRAAMPARVSPPDLVATAQALSATFPVPRPAQLLLDITDLEQGVLDAACAEWMRTRFAVWLRSHPADVRVEPVRLERGRLRLARGYAWDLLKFPFPRPADEPADVRAGSLILFTAATWTEEREAVLLECRRRGARLVLLKSTTQSAEPAHPRSDLAELTISSSDEAAASLLDRVCL